VRHRLRSGGLELKRGWLQILQTAVAACAAWFISVLVLGLDRPTFVPIAAVICLGLAVGERARRAIELTVGVAFGIAIADFLVSAVGVGALQAGLVVALAMTVAVFLGRDEIGVKEAAISAMIIMITFHYPDTGVPVERFLESLIGGATALLMNALLPINPERMVTEAAHPVFDESVAVLDEVADALESGDAERAQRSYVKAREIDARVSGLKEAVAAGRETARLAPPRRRSLGHLKLYAGAADQIDLTVRDVRALSRAALSVAQPGTPSPGPPPAATRGLARGTETLATYLETAGARKTRAASRWRPRRRLAPSCTSAKTWRATSPSTRSSTRSTHPPSTSSSEARAWTAARHYRPSKRQRAALLRAVGHQRSAFSSLKC
jgi:uncharacterized membrane protein YccC